MTCPSSEELAAMADDQSAQTRTLREHTGSCARCSAELAQLRALTAALGRLTLAGPAAAFSGELAAKLNRPRRPHALLAGATALAVVAVALLRSDGDEPSFTPRGSSVAPGSRVGVEVRVHPPGLGEPVRLIDQPCVAAQSGYSFVVYNRTRRTQMLMLFALDARRDVHWFYPAYLDPHSDPSSFSVGTDPEVQTLPEGVTPDDLAPGDVQFVALFSNAPQAVSEIEALLQRGGLAAVRGALPKSELQVTHARVCATEHAP